MPWLILDQLCSHFHQGNLAHWGLQVDTEVGHHVIIHDVSLGIRTFHDINGSGR